jgi:type II protein arginine methyltransferase
MNNLSSGTYEVFENDVKKYDRYEHAIQAALVDYKKNGCFNRQIEFNGPLQEHEIDLYVDQLKQESSMILSNRQDYSNGVIETPVQVMVFGAGRGPLIIRAINASRNCGVPIEVTAVEKNRYAVIAIKNMIADNGIEDLVTLFQGDMRDVNLEMKADIIVSELLGSFGDNELSPECLFPVQRFMHSGSISIPSYYRSQVAPISSQVLWNEVKLAQETRGSS